MVRGSCLTISSPKMDGRASFMTQRLDRIQLCSLVRRVVAEEHSHQRRRRECQQDRQRDDHRAHVAHHAEQPGAADPRPAPRSGRPAGSASAPPSETAGGHRWGWRRPPGGCRSRALRSVTLTSMMFMIPIPPTISETPATQASRLRKAAVVDSCVSMMSCCVVMLKSGSSSVTSWRLASSSWICRIMLSRSASSSTST